MRPRSFLRSAAEYIVRISPERAPDPSDPAWNLASANTDAVPMGRIELRHELSFASMLLTASAFADIALVDVHYDVCDLAGQARVATPWTL